MFSTIKPLMAVCLSLLVVAATGVWFRGRTDVLKTLQRERQEAETRANEAKGRSAALSGLSAKQSAINQATREIKKGLAPPNQAVTALVRTVARALSESGTTMTGASEMPLRGKYAARRDLGVDAVLYKITLSGDYIGLVRLLQALATADLQNKVESLEIEPVDEKPVGQKLEIEIVLAAFSEKA